MAFNIIKIIQDNYKKTREEKLKILLEEIDNNTNRAYDRICELINSSYEIYFKKHASPDDQVPLSLEITPTKIDENRRALLYSTFSEPTTNATEQLNRYFKFSLIDLIPIDVDPIDIDALTQKLADAGASVYIGFDNTRADTMLATLNIAVKVKDCDDFIKSNDHSKKQ